MERVIYCPRAFGSRPAFAAHLVSPLRASNQDSLNLRFGFSWGALVAKLFRLPDGQISSCFARLPVQPHLQKYFCFGPRQISSLIRAVPSQERGVAHVTNVGRDAVDAAAPLTNGAGADGEVVWF